MIRTCAGRDALPRDPAWHVSTLRGFWSSRRPPIVLVHSIFDRSRSVANGRIRWQSNEDCNRLEPAGLAVPASSKEVEDEGTRTIKRAVQ